MNIKKKINFLAIIGMMVAFGTFAFTAPKENKMLALEWYDVTPNPGNPLLDEIGQVSSDPTQGGDCQAIDTDIRCAIQLDLSNATEMPETVEDALNDQDVVVGKSTFKDETP